MHCFLVTVECFVLPKRTPLQSCWWSVDRAPPSSQIYIAKTSSAFSDVKLETDYFPSFLKPHLQVPLSKNTTVGYKGTTQQEQKDIAVLKSRVDKIEKTVAAYYKPKVGQSIPQIALNSRTVELSAIVSFFFIGTLIGASLLDRLWLLGGISMAYWASGAVNRDTRGGLLARRVGVQVVQFIRDWQEKYNQLVIFYQTGQLAYTTSKIWEGTLIDIY